MPLKTKTSASAARDIRANEAQQARVRARLERLGGELKPLRRPRASARRDSDDLWGIRSLLRSVRVDVKTTKTEVGDLAAQSVAETLASCGFHTRMISEKGVSWEGVHIESQPDQAGAALLIQGAFRIAGLGAGLTIHDRAAADRIVVHVGARALG